MAGSLIRELRRAVLPLVKATPDVAAITTRVYAASEVPPEPTFPFGRLDGFVSIPLNGRCVKGANLTFLAHGFAKDHVEGGSIVETAEDYAERLGSALVVAINGKRVTVTGRTIRLGVRTVRLVQDPVDKAAYHSILECEARVLAA